MRKRCRFFFKAKCLNNDAPYQLLKVEDADALLPIFEGQIAAECRSLSDTE